MRELWLMVLTHSVSTQWTQSEFWKQIKNGSEIKVDGLDKILGRKLEIEFLKKRQPLSVELSFWLIARATAECVFEQRSVRYFKFGE